MSGTLNHALRQQMAISSAAHQVFIPGANTTAIAKLIEYGYRYTGLELLLSSQAMPDLDRVVFYDADLL
jgi:hypothetical protein